MRSRYLKILLLTAGVFIVTAVVVNGVVDPFHYYHKPWFEIGYSDNQRFQNPGLARTADYDIVLIGTSHTEPVITSHIGETLNGRALNLSISGSLVEEQALMLELVLAQGKVRRVLWEINYPSFLFLDGGVSEPGSMPFFLFEPGAETPFRYLVSWDTFMESVSALRGERPDDLDNLHRWDLQTTFGREQVLSHWAFMSRRWNDDVRDSWRYFSIEEQDMLELVDQNIGRLAKKYPEVEFDLLLLPATLLEYGNDLQVSERRLDRRLSLRGETARLARDHHNVAVWDFQNVRWMTEDLNHYKDIDHFDQAVIDSLLQSLASGEHRARPAEVIAGSRQLERRVANYMERFCSDDPGRCQPALLEALSGFRERRKIE